ncbi:MAG: preprotein translocase subunit SecE [Ruminococcaceae bacterium]|nr:preprotein translocase subunit SecE [Oscillospiraceae bacterium]
MAEQNVQKTNKVSKFFKDLKREMKNIVWSPKKDVVKNTTVVIVVTAVVAIAITLVDGGLTSCINWLAEKF